MDPFPVLHTALLPVISKRRASVSWEMEVHAQVSTNSSVSDTVVRMIRAMSFSAHGQDLAACWEVFLSAKMPLLVPLPKAGEFCFALMGPGSLQCNSILAKRLQADQQQHRFTCAQQLRDAAFCVETAHLLTIHR